MRKSPQIKYDLCIKAEGQRSGGFFCSEELTLSHCYNDAVLFMWLTLLPSGRRTLWDDFMLHQDLSSETLPWQKQFFVLLGEYAAKNKPSVRPSTTGWEAGCLCEYLKGWLTHYHQLRWRLVFKGSVVSSSWFRFLVCLTGGDEFFFFVSDLAQSGCQASVCEKPTVTLCADDACWVKLVLVFRPCVNASWYKSSLPSLLSTWRFLLTPR